MEISQEQAQNKPQGDIQVTILKLNGVLDKSTYRQLLESVEKASAEGTSNLLLDLDEVSFMSSAGLAALHGIALLMRQERLSDFEKHSKLLTPMQAFVERAGGPEKHIKLLNPQPGVLNTLQQVEFDRIFEIYSDRDTALASFV